MSDPAGDLYKVTVALAQIVQEATDLYRLICAASGFNKDEYGNKVSTRVADGLLSQRDGLIRTGHFIRSHVRLPDGSPQEPHEPHVESTEAAPQPTTVHQPVTVGEAAAVLRKHCKGYLDDARRGAADHQNREAASRLIDALSHAALLRD